jgi:argininosuccinate synthase
MKSPVVLAFGGGLHASAAVPWLIETYGVEVVTVTLDVGQGRELGELRARALACGAVRAHVIDARDEFARDVLLPPLAKRPLGGDAESVVAAPIARLPWPLIARKLTEVARIEGAEAVAHGSSDFSCDAAIQAVDASVRVLAPAREWGMSASDLHAYARARRLPVDATVPDCRVDENLWGRVCTWDGDEEPVMARVGVRLVREPAFVDIHFESGVPTSVNGVPMSPAELIECLSLIGGQHGIGRVVITPNGSHHVVHEAPAATVLHAAASASGDSATGDVCVKLSDGHYTVLSASDRNSLLVNYA